MGLKDLFTKGEALISIDIGLSGVKLIELDASSDVPQLVNIAAQPFAADVFNNNVISKTEVVSEAISGMLEANAIGDQRAVVAMPGPSVFTKRVSMPKMSPAELTTNVQFEAGNFIPHNVDAVKIDYHVIGEKGKNNLDVLVVAVKSEIVASFVECLSLAGLEAAVVDVDYFALQNCFEISYPELIDKTVTLIDIGARYSSINICKAGQSLFTGDLAIGGRLFTDVIAQETGVSPEEAEKIKKDKHASGVDQEVVHDVIDRKIEYVASEFNRQLSLFWNASGAEEGIDKIMLTGGGSLIPGLLEELSEKTGIECGLIDPFKGIECGEDFDSSYLEELKPSMAVCIGMGIRHPGDKEIPDFS